MQPHTKVPAGDVSLRKQFRGYALDGGDRYGDAYVPGQRGSVDPDDAALHVNQRPAGKSGIEIQVRADELIDVAAAPRPPRAAQRANDAEAGGDSIFSSA